MAEAPKGAGESARVESAGSQTDALAAAVLEIVRGLAAERRPQQTVSALTLDSRLERDLGLDSLASVELLARLERALHVTLSEQILASAETPRDLLRALQGARAQARVPPSATPRIAAPEGVVAAPVAATTLIEALDWHVQRTPQRTHIYLLGDNEQEEALAYAELRDRATAFAGGLRERGLQPGQTVAIMLPTGREYFFSFFGVLLAGGVPVPIYPPVRASQIEDHLRRHARILESARARLLITVPEARPVARLLKLAAPALRQILTARELAQAGGGSAAAALGADDIALLQYTSGSTGNPKGAILTHANLLANIRAMGAATAVSARDVFVSWMPLYHDMGLIGAWLGSLYYGMPLVVMSPLSFLTHPERWLWAVHRHRATLSGAPNFGYELCLRRIEDSALAGLDLSSWRMAFNGAEPVSPETLARFQKRFARYGLRPEALAPVYGLAESSVGLAFPPLGRGPLVDRIRRDEFVHTGHAVPAADDDPAALRFVACGQPLPGHQIRLVDATGFEVGEREEGRLEFKGPSATSGYFRNPEETARLFHGDWLDSGDLAYTAGGDVYITGRVKDLIIRAGRNIYPHEIEEAVGDIEGIRKGCVAVFGTTSAGTERLVVLAETRATEEAARARLRAEVNAVVVDLIGDAPDEVVLAPPHTVLKTSSGKIRRAASRELYESGHLGAPRALAWQLTRLALTTAAPQLRRAMHLAGDILYAAYVGTLFWLLAPLTWAVVAVLPRPDWSRAAARAAAKLLLRLSGLPLRVQGLDRLPQRPCVVVANHASYIDGIVLSAVLPPVFTFTAKREFADRFIARIFLKRLDAVFVERFEASRGAEDARRLAQFARAGKSLAFFPEGTFQRMSGLLPFHLGAFAAAAEAGTPVVPVALRGTRSVLRAGQWFPRRAALSVTVGEPLAPRGAGWAETLRLHDAARATILQHCGEPDLAAHAPPG